jgi:hypothetical protein
MSFSQSQIGVPNVSVNIIPPNPLLNGVPTNIIGVVGTAEWGPVNSQVTVGNIQEYAQIFGNPQARLYDLGTPIYAATQQGANNFICVRVTDGTDTAASCVLLDTTTPTPLDGCTLTSLYTGSLPNDGNLTAVLSQGSGYTSSNKLYRLTISFSNGIPEVFDGIGGTGAEFWSNLADAVNLGQGALRGPSQIVSASTGNNISSVSVTAGGSYATLPTLGTSGSGSGATLNPVMRALSGVISAAGTGYVPADTITLTGGTHSINTVLTVSTVKAITAAVNAAGSGYNIGDTIVAAGGTFTTAAVITVDTVDGAGAVLTAHISTGGSYTVRPSGFTQGSTSGVGTGATFNTLVWGVNTVSVTTPGSYTALPSSPVSQGSTSGAGTGATFTMLWELLSVVVSAGGTGYNSSTLFTVTGGGSTGGATGTLSLGSAITPPALASYNFSGGSDGAANVTTATLVGVDTYPRTGMYVLRNSNASVVMLADAYDSTYWTNQDSFAQQENTYVVGTVQSGTSISSSVSQKQTAGINSYNFKLMTGDWTLINDPFNNVTRYISPQGFTAGEIAVQPPNGSALNKVMNGIIATQKTAQQQVYTDADLLQLEIGGLDVITNPIPAGKSFGVRLGINTSNNPLTKVDNYPRMVNFLANTFKQGLGAFIGLPQTVDVRLQAKSTLQAFLQNLQQLGLIGNVNGGPAFSVVLDASNNPLNQVSLGFMQANVQVTLFSIIQQFVINLQAGQNIQVQTLPPQLA